MSDDIQRLIETLSQAGTSAELDAESLAVDAIASAMTTNGTPMISKYSKRARVASFITAGVIGFGGVAAAGPAVLDQISPSDDTEEVVVDDSVPETTEVEVTETTEVEDTTPSTTEVEEDEDVTETSVADDDDVDDESDADDDGEDVDAVDVSTPKVDDPTTAFNEEECADGNHGKTVSSVARTEGRSSDDVRDAAHSKCGKDKPADHDDDDADDGDDDADHSDDSDDDKGHGSSDRGNGNGNRNGADDDKKSDDADHDSDDDSDDDEKASSDDSDDDKDHSDSDDDEKDDDAKDSGGDRDNGGRRGGGRDK